MFYQRSARCHQLPDGHSWVATTTTTTGPESQSSIGARAPNERRSQ